MGYVFDFKDSIAYEKWLKAKENEFALKQMDNLLFNLLKPIKNNSILDIGCGTGRNLLSFVEKGLDASGIDASVYMTDIASKNLGDKARIYTGFGEDLPFDDNSFNYSSIITSIEFSDNYKVMIEEACRVTKDRLVIIFLNKYAFKSIERLIRSFFFSGSYGKIKFFSIWELKYFIKSILGDVPIKWQTALQLPVGQKTAQKIESFPFTSKSPIGTFAGICVTLTPRFRTTPLKLKAVSRFAEGVTVFF